MKIEPKTLKGFRDFLPTDARKRNYVLNTLKKVFESYGFEPLETPVLEYEEILAGKYGDEGDKLMYRFEDNGDRKVAMRYDQTVPLARVVAQYANELPLPFKRYQIQNVWRADNTQKGRYREFLQVDIDTVGSSSPLADAEILTLVYDAFKKLGINIKIRINDRSIFEGINPKYLPTIDKLNKIGKEGVLKELEEKGLEKIDAKEIFKKVTSMEPPQNVVEVMSKFQKMGYPLDSLKYDSLLVRGLDYYTGLIFEVVCDDYPAGSLGGGGRYDNLIGMFTGNNIPAVGFSFGFDRVIEAMIELNLFPADLGGAKVLVTNTAGRSANVANDLRSENINVELYVDEKDLDKQLRYADKKGIPYVLIVSDKKLELKNMKTGVKEEVKLEQLPNVLKH